MSTEPPEVPTTLPPIRCEEGDEQAYQPLSLRYSTSDGPIKPGQAMAPLNRPMPEDELDVFYRPHFIMDFQQSVKIKAIKVNAADGSKVPVSTAYAYKEKDDSSEIQLMDDFDETYIFKGTTGQKINLPGHMPPVKQLKIYIVPEIRYGVDPDLTYSVEEFQECVLPGKYQVVEMLCPSLGNCSMTETSLTRRGAPDRLR